MREMQATIDRILQPTREMQATIDRILQPTPEMQATLDAFAHLSLQVSPPGTTTEKFLRDSAKAFQKNDIADVITQEAGSLVEDPERWIFKQQEAAESGDPAARRALLIVGNLFACFMILARSKTPSWSTIGRCSAGFALIAVMTIFSLYLHNEHPKTAAKIASVLSIPSGAIALFSWMSPPRRAGEGRKKFKDSRGRSKPKPKTLRKFHSH